MRRRQAIVLLALAGLLVSLYLWLYKIGVIGTLQCGTGGCEYVQASRYAERSEEHTSELQSRPQLVCRHLLEQKKQNAMHNAGCMSPCQTFRDVLKVS